MESENRIPIRVALFTGAYNHIADGVSLTLNRLVDYLTKHGVEVLVFAPSADNPALDHAGTLIEIPSITAPGRPDYRVSKGLSRRIRSQIAAFQPSLIHIATPDFLGLSALRYARRHNIPAVASYHTHFSSYLKYYRLGMLEGGLWRYLRWFYGNCEQVYVPTSSMADVLRSHGISSGLLDWPRGVETHRFSPKNSDPEWRVRQGFMENDVVVAFVGRLVWEKGLDVFASAIELLKTRGVPVKSLVVGDGPARAELIHRIPNGVFAGHLEGTDLTRAYASADIFLFPSETETFGNVTLEAMASGLPAVCANATGSSTLVVHGETGFLVDPKDVAGFADRLEELTRDVELRNTMSVKSRARAMEFDWDAVLSRIPRYYNDLLAARADSNDDHATIASEAVSTGSAVVAH
ncbi:MAG: glycosyltransferase family 1 protein [Rhodothermales bacterium]|nr:glycosyltransferase family 1 protein [Rhodothermales bacterium]